MTGSLQLTDLVATYDGETPVLDGVDLEVSGGELVCVIGPSGCGKTTLLRAIAGLTPLHAGDIRIDGSSLRDLPPSRRPTAMVFQSDTLFGDLTVGENVAFGLSVRGLADQRAKDVLRVTLLRLGLVGLQHRRPHELSGGQQRRVALARALVLEPSVLLLDEPVSGVDEELRDQIVRQLRAHQRRLGTTTLMVTHDQQEALAVADRLIVMRSGTIEQVGPPQQVYDRPNTPFVANFLGRSNLIPVPVIATHDHPDGVRATVRLLGKVMTVAAHPSVTGADRAVLLVRPHDLTIQPLPSPTRSTDVSDDNALVAEVYYGGDHWDYVLESSDGMLWATTAARTPVLPEGHPARVHVDAHSAWALPT